MIALLRQAMLKYFHDDDRRTSRESQYGLDEWMTMETERLLEDITFAAIDIETTGLTPVVDSIVEIGAVRFREDEVQRGHS
jgi:DNA polymerase III epsilon subunit-like protein